MICIIILSFANSYIELYQKYIYQIVLFLVRYNYTLGGTNMKSRSILFKSINDTLSWNIVKRVLLLGIPLAVIWIFVANMLFDQTMALTSEVIGWIPFSILKANAAFLIGSFSWIIAILATYALIMALLNIPIYKILTPKRYETFSIILIISIAIGWTLFAIFNWGFVYSEVAKMLTWFPFNTLQEGVSSLLAILIFYNFYIVSLYFIVLLFNKSFLKHIASNDYPNTTETNSISKAKYISIIIKDICIFTILLLVSYPLFFVPFINIIIQVFLWSWLIKESYFLSSASLYATKEDIDKLNNHPFQKWSLAFGAAILNLIPIVNIFSPFFAQSLFFHWVMQTKLQGEL